MYGIFFFDGKLFNRPVKLFSVNRFTFFIIEPGKSVYLPKVYPPPAKHRGGQTHKKGGVS